MRSGGCPVLGPGVKDVKVTRRTPVLRVTMQLGWTWDGDAGAGGQDSGPGWASGEGSRRPVSV